MNVLTSIHQSLKIITAYVCQLILFAFGWHPMSATTYHQLAYMKRSTVLLFPHTSYWDYVLAVLYMYSECLQHKLYFVMSQHIFDMFWYLRPLFYLTNCIPVPKLSDSPQNTVQTITTRINTLNTHSPKIVLISPNGSTKGSVHNQWRKGWYHIAAGLSHQPQIGVIGLNYHPLIRSIHFGHLHGNYINPHETSLEQAQQLCAAHMSTFYTKFPQEALVTPVTPKWKHVGPITHSNIPHSALSYQSQVDTSAIDIVTLTAFLGLIPLTALYSRGAYFVCMLCTITWFYNLLYHYHMEQKFKTYNFISATFTLGYMVHCMITSAGFGSFMKMMCVMVFCGCAYIYMQAMPRHTTLLRSKKYTYMHSLFQNVISLMVLGYSYLYSSYSI